MGTENLIESFERQEVITARIERILFGDPPVHPVGLVAQIDLLNHQLGVVSGELAAVKRKRPNLWLWGAGYLTFLLSGLFAMSAFYYYPPAQALLDMPPHLALWLAVMFALAAALLFAGGFGWLDRG